MRVAQLDKRRRLLMPPECPPNSAVTIQRVDAESWLVKRQGSQPGIVVVLTNDVATLPDDPAWEKKEARLARHLAKTLPEPRF
jgi:hypothetical protein